MNMLLVLLLIQVTGVLLASSIASYIHARERKRMYVSRRFGRRTQARDKNWQWMVDYLQAHPGSSLKNMFPDLYNMAMATRRYKELNRLRKTGRLSEQAYERKLQKLLKEVDIRTDFEMPEYDQ
jgi:biopolymer transport protein ExbB/TolQ